MLCSLGWNRCLFGNSSHHLGTYLRSSNTLIGPDYLSTPARNLLRTKSPPHSLHENKNTRVLLVPLDCLPRPPNPIWLHLIHFSQRSPTNRHAVTSTRPFTCSTTFTQQLIMVLPSPPKQWYHSTRICCSPTAQAYEDAVPPNDNNHHRLTT